ncbi:hypothetical protein CR513_61955, partial [Mucuna pruriens]
MHFLSRSSSSLQFAATSRKVRSFPLSLHTPLIWIGLFKVECFAFGWLKANQSSLSRVNEVVAPSDLVLILDEIGCLDHCQYYVPEVAGNLSNSVRPKHDVCEDG